MTINQPQPQSYNGIEQKKLSDIENTLDSGMKLQ